MLRFLGNIEAKLDAKGRVFVPASFRKILQAACETELILRKDIFQNCLVLYPRSVWDAQVSELRSKLNRWGKQEQQIFRQYVWEAEQLDIDASGRVLISKRCQEMIGVSSEVCFLGVDNTIELWAKEDLESSMVSVDKFADELQRLMLNERE